MTRPLSALGRASKPAIAVTASVVALVVSGTTAVFSFWPSLKPDPGETISASVDVQGVQPAVTLGAYLARTHRALPGADADDRRLRGAVVYARVRVEGRKHHPLQLDEVYYDAHTRRRLAGQDDAPLAALSMDTTNDQWIEPVFALNDMSDRPYFARVSVYDGRTLLAYADSPALPR